MSTTKRKSSTPPPSTHKKRKHKHSKSTPSSSQIASSQAVSSSLQPQLFSKARLKAHIAIPPSATTSTSVYVHSHLISTLLLKHTAQGTIVSLSGFNSTGGTGRILDECPFSWSWFEGDIVLFNPQIGQRIPGIVKLSSPDHIALIAFGLFNVSVPRTELPEKWSFDESVWYDHEGNRVEGEVMFEVTQLITSSSILSMLGSLKHMS